MRLELSSGKDRGQWRLGSSLSDSKLSSPKNLMGEASRREAPPSDRRPYTSLRAVEPLFPFCMLEDRTGLVQMPDEITHMLGGTLQWRYCDVPCFIQRLYTDSAKHTCST